MIVPSSSSAVPAKKGPDRPFLPGIDRRRKVLDGSAKTAFNATNNKVAFEDRKESSYGCPIL